MGYLRDVILNIQSDKKKVENEWADFGLQIASLRFDDVVSEPGRISERNFNQSDNPYLRIIRKTMDFTNQVASYFKGNNSLSKEIKTLAIELGHAVEKKGNVGLSISDANGPLIDVDFSGNIEFKTKDISGSSLQQYIDAVTRRYKDSDSYIVYKAGDKFSKAENEDILRVVLKSFLNNDVDFKRVHVADKNLQYLVDEMSPSPIRLEMVDGKFVRSEKDFTFNKENLESLLAHRGLNLVKYSGGELDSFKKYAKIFEIEHRLRVGFAEKGEVISFSSTVSDNVIHFKTATVKNGGQRLKEEYSKKLAEFVHRKKLDAYEALFGSTSYEHQYDAKGNKSEIKRTRGYRYA